MTVEKKIDTFSPSGRQAWRRWLQENHAKKQSVWLVYYKKKSTTATISYNDSVEEALCFGWIDGRAKPIDGEKFMRFFCKRKTNGTWSKINKTKIKRLVNDGLMTKVGLDAVNAAKKNGSWRILDEVEKLILPADLQKQFRGRPNAKKYFSALSRSDKRSILQWLVLAKRPETRQSRINEIAELADQNLKPKQFRR